METHDLAFEVKEVGDDGVFSGYAAIFNNVDLGNDKILPGAFIESLQRNKGKIPIYADHRTHIGYNLQAEEDSRGLKVKGQLNLEVQLAREKHALAKQAKEVGGKMGLSIGYSTIDRAYEDDVRLLKKLDLFEYSLTAIPMNPKASVTAIKTHADFLEMKPEPEETESEIRIRILPPGNFQSDSFRRTTLKDSKPRVFAIIGKLKGETSTTVQALRFLKDDGWTKASAVKWAKDHDFVKMASSLDWKEGGLCLCLNENIISDVRSFETALRDAGVSKSKAQASASIVFGRSDTDSTELKDVQAEMERIVNILKK